jgi:hypothetical protein
LCATNRREFVNGILFVFSYFGVIGLIIVLVYYLIYLNKTSSSLPYHALCLYEKNTFIYVFASVDNLSNSLVLYKIESSIGVEPIQKSISYLMSERHNRYTVIICAKHLNDKIDE